MLPIPDNHPLRRYFAGLVESTFCARVGLCDPTLTDYLSDLLVNFTHIEQLQLIRNAQGKPLEQIAAMLLVVLDDDGQTSAEHDRAVYRHIGDYALFWTGLYPEQLRRLRCDSPDLLIDYTLQGKRSYATVAELCSEDADPPSELFRHLSEDFESCVYGLGLVREGLTHTPGTEHGLLY